MGRKASIIAATLLGAAVGAGSCAAVLSLGHAGPASKAEPGPGTEVPAAAGSPQGMSSGGTGDLGPWQITVADHVAIGPVDQPTRHIVTVTVHNNGSKPLDLAAPRFSSAMTNGFSSASAPGTTDCAPDDGTPLPRTGTLAPGATVTGRLCVPNPGHVGPGPEWFQLSAYLLDSLLLQSTLRMGMGDSWAGTGNAQLALTADGAVVDGPNVRVRAHLVTAGSNPYWQWLPAVTLLPSGTGDPTKSECRPDSAFTASTWAASEKPSATMRTDSFELCAVGEKADLLAGYLPRLYWNLKSGT